MRACVALALLVGQSTLAVEPACTPDGIVVLPASGSVVPVNVQWLLEGVGAEQARVTELVGSVLTLLPTDDSGAIDVKVERGWVSQMKRVAVKLKPLTPLKASTTYVLALGTALTGAKLLNDPGGDGSLRWTTGQGADKDPPRYRSRPGVAEGRYVAGEKEPLVRQLRLRLDVEERSWTYLVISMQRMRGSTLRQQYPVPVEGDHAVIGHDGCGGSFGWEDGRAYKLQFELFDAAGNRNTERVTLEVSAPRPPKQER